MGKNIINGLIAPLFLFGALVFMSYVFKTLDVDIKPIVTVMVILTPVWLPFVLFQLLYDQWIWFVQEKFKFKNGRTTLRIKLPQEVFKSPEAMESVFTQIFNPNSPDNLMQTYLDGKHPLVSSFELVSIGGDIRFYANVPTKKVKNTLEAQLYAQYPGIEIVEEPLDYTAEVKWDPKVWDMISFHILKKSDAVMPIKTYIEFGMDKLPKEEFKFDPMSPLIEHLGNAKPHERVWIQILITPHVKKTFKNGNLYKASTWDSKANAKVDELMGRDKAGLGAEETESRPILTTDERGTIESIQRNVGKYAYSTAIRAMYITKTGKFDPDMIGPMLRAFGQFDVVGRNGLGPKWRTDFGYNFIQDITGSRKLAMKKNELESYKNRYYLYGDKKNRVDAEKVMSVEELATIFHIPGTTIVTPNLSRVETTRKEAPSNLPV